MPKGRRRLIFIQVLGLRYVIFKPHIGMPGVHASRAFVKMIDWCLSAGRPLGWSHFDTLSQDLNGNVLGNPSESDCYESNRNPRQ